MKKAFIQLHIAVFLAGFTGVLGQLISLNEGMLVWYRLLITSATMWILFSFQRKIQPITRADMLKLAGIGFIAALHWVTFYGSIKSANISVALVCFSAVGFFTALLEPVILQVRIKWTEVLLGLLVIVGIYIIFHFDTRFKRGIILGVASAFFLAIVMIILRQFVQRMNTQTILTYQLTGGFITLSACMPFYLAYFPAKSLLPGWEDIGWLLILSWFCSVWAFQLSAAALKKLSAFTVNLNFNLEPVYGIILAFIIYNENEFLSKWFYLGLLIIAAALFIHVVLLLKDRKKKIVNAGH